MLTLLIETRKSRDIQSDNDYVKKIPYMQTFRWYLKKVIKGLPKNHPKKSSKKNLQKKILQKNLKKSLKNLKKKIYTFQKRHKKSLKNKKKQTIYSYALACFTKFLIFYFYNQNKNQA